jgi:hypothetical protein
MPGCVLRVSGKSFDTTEFLRTSSLQPCKVYEGGAPKAPGLEVRWAANGFNVVASNADGDDVGQQIADAEQFLDAHRAEIERLTQFPGVDTACLDFGMNCRHEAVWIQTNVFPWHFLKRLALLKIDLEVSVYPPVSDEPESTAQA